MPELHWHSRSIGSFNFLDERRWQLRLAMARVRSQRQIIINGYRRNLKLEDSNCVAPTRIAQIPPLFPDSSGMRSQFATLSAAVHCSHNTNTWSPFPIHTEEKMHHNLRPIEYRTWITTRCACEERVRFERRDLRRIERSGCCFALAQDVRFGRTEWAAADGDRTSNTIFKLPRLSSQPGIFDLNFTYFLGRRLGTRAGPGLPKFH